MLVVKCAIEEGKANLQRQNTDDTPFEDLPLKEQTQESEGPMASEKTAAEVSPSTIGEAEISRSQLSIGKRLLNWRTLVPLVIVLGLLVYTAQKLQINPGQTWAAVRSANVIFFLAAFITYYLSFPIRTLRWRLLLENVGYTGASKGSLPGESANQASSDNGALPGENRNQVSANKGSLPKFRKLLEIVYISWFANAIVPAKLGDVYRAYLLRQESGVSATRTFGTVLAERLLDLGVLLLLFLSAIIISLHANLPSFLRAGLYVTLAIVLIGITALFLLRIFRARIRRFIPARFQDYYDHLQEGTLGSFRRIPLLLPLTIAVWLCETGRFFFIALSLNLIAGGLPHIGATAMFIALGEALLTIVPFTSGGIGLVEGGMIAMLALFTSARNLAAAGIVLDRTISLFSILVIGLIVFLVVSARRVTHKQIHS